MPYWDVSLVTDMNDLFSDKGSFNADISRGTPARSRNMFQMFRNAYTFNADISRWDVSSVTNMHRMSGWHVSSVTNMLMFQYAFNADITRWDTSSVTNMEQMFFIANAWTPRFHNCGSDSSHQACGEVAFYTPSTATAHGPPAAWVRKDDACDASTPPLNGDVGNCTDTLVSGTSCVPECHPGYVLQGVTSCTDRVLTQEAVCVPEVSTRAELKAAVDACIGDRFCEPTMPHWDVSRVTT